MIAEFISTDDSRWDDCLSRLPHDFFHLPRYLQFTGDYEDGEPCAFYAREGDAEFLAPMLIRQLPQDLGNDLQWLDIITPYGLPSPLMSHPNDTATLRKFMEAFRDRCRERKIVSAFFRMHPLLDFPLEALEAFGCVVRHGRVVVVDLTQSQEEIEAGTRREMRRDIRKLKDAGYTVEMDVWSRYETYIEIYRMTMERVEASKFYFFDDDYFHGIREALQDNLHLCTVMAPDGNVASAGLLVQEGGFIYAHLGGTHKDYTSDAPSKLMMACVRDFSKQIGYHSFNLGGGIGGSDSDSLFAFKRGYSKLRPPFHTFRMILDEQKYTELERRWRALTTCSNDQADHFFPSYRKRC